MTEGQDRGDWSLEELLDAFREATQNELHTAIPGRVDAYDAATQRADVTPLVKRALEAEDGSRVDELLPAIRNVPVLQLRAGPFFVHVPVAAGDTCLLVVAERDISRWLRTGEISVAPDVRLHHISQAIALPGLFVTADPIEPAPSSSAMELGHESGGAKITITSSEIRAGGTTALAEYPNLAEHLAAIAADLDIVHGAAVGGPAPNYGALARAALNLSHPIPTDILKGD